MFTTVHQPIPAIARAHLGWGPLLGLHEVGTAAWMRGLPRVTRCVVIRKLEDPVLSQ